MRQQNSQLEVTIISEAAVREYAQSNGEFGEKTLIDETLIQDDRARRVVRKHSKSLHDQPVSDDLSEHLKAGLNNCQNTVVGYELLSRTAVPPTIAQFATSRFEQRWRLLNEIRQALPSANDDINVDILEASENTEESLQIIKATAKRDEQLAGTLREALDVADLPAWKAQIAEWISNVESDLGQISWLSNGFMKQADRPA